MDFGGGFATGIAVGIGSGLASGTVTGRKQTVAQLRHYIEDNGIEVHDRYGKPIKLDDFMENAVSCSSGDGCCSSKKKWVLLGMVGILAIGGAAFAVMKAFGG